MTNAAAVATAQHGPQSPEAARLRQTFGAIIFDWDGTAVTDRREDATALAAVAEALLRWRGWLAVVTGTHFGNIDQQFIRLLAPVARRHLLVCVNRGSEVYGFDRHGAPVRRFLRIASSEEEAALTRIAEAVRDRLVAETGLEIRIVYNRLNRRKIDLIPLPEWTDPPKAQIGALLTAVDDRLHHAGLASGLPETIALTRRVAREQGMADARITSDVKHIEIGLTDKRDSVEWLRRELLSPHHISISDVLIAGDEFGPIAGLDGSDDLLRAGMEGAMVISVGAEPGGVPESVLALGGGPARFRALLAEQVALRQETAVAEDVRRAARAASRLRAASVAADAFVSTTSPAWHLDTAAYDPALEHEVESRFAISNGFLGVRASLEEQTIASRPRTLVAGLFDTPAPEPGGAPVTPALVSGPDWLQLRLLLDGEPLASETSARPVGIRTLDLRRGLLIHAWRQHSGAGYEVGLRTLRFASLSDRALGVQVAEISVDQPVALTLETWIEPTSTNLHPVLSDGAVPVWHTAGGERQLAVAQFAELAIDRRLIRASIATGGRQCWTWTAMPGQPAYFARTVAFTAGSAAVDLGTLALAALQQARQAGLPRLLGDHVREWGVRWTASDVAVEGDEAAQQALRFAVYHLVSAA
ncbi:MAG TPA: hypothetical protein VFU63_07280, partial [Ktedonobacterales bacterium]|nr:hypothetical protein [Ktedonobacterales bacterium]